MSDWNEEKGDYDKPLAPQGFRWCCYQIMVNNPPTKPHQHCPKGHPLSWYDPDNPERGFFDCDEEHPYA